MHQGIGQVTVSGKQQQARGVVIQATDGYPTSGFQFWQTCENRAPALGVIARAYFCSGLVIKNTASFFCRNPLQRLAVYHYARFIVYPVAQLGRLAIDVNTPGLNPGLHFTPGAQTTAGQDFL